MGDRSHTHRQRYIEFRFEQSLRKYEPPPRKMIKMGSSLCKNCDRKSCESKHESRLIRLCETRKLYNATSRQKASEFSRRKQANQMSYEKASEHVSDFNCIESGQHQFDTLKSYQQSQNMEFKISKMQTVKQKSERNENSLKWEISIKQTPIKQQIRQQLKITQNSESKSNIQEDKVAEDNKGKVKDIEFHIGLVEQLHKKISEYIKLEAEILNHSIINEVEDNKNVSEQLCTCEMQEQAVEKNDAPPQKQEKENVNVEQQDVQFVTSYQMKECVRNQILNDEMQNQVKQIERIAQNECSLQQKVGRIQIKCEKGRCLLSARIMNKLLQSSATPDRIRKTVLRHHPYIEDIQCILKVTYLK